MLDCFSLVHEWSQSNLLRNHSFFFCHCVRIGQHGLIKHKRKWLCLKCKWCTQIYCCNCRFVGVFIALHFILLTSFISLSVSICVISPTEVLLVAIIYNRNLVVYNSGIVIQYGASCSVDCRFLYIRRSHFFSSAEISQVVSLVCVPTSYGVY